MTAEKVDRDVTLFDYYIVLDFEATCEKDVRIEKPEIIEFPLVLVDARTTTILTEFQRYVKPQKDTILSAFCKELTGIQQSTVDQAQPFPAVYKEAITWLEDNNIGFTDDKKTFAVVTCGDWDLRTMLPTQLSLCGTAESLTYSLYFARWVNIKKVFQNLVPQTKGTGLEMMLAYYDLPLIGKHHSGIDDCRNIASVLIHMLRNQIKLDITSTTDCIPRENLPPYRRTPPSVMTITHKLAAASLAPFPNSPFIGNATSFKNIINNNNKLTAIPSIMNNDKVSTCGAVSSPVSYSVIDSEGMLLIRDDKDPMENLIVHRKMADKERETYSRRLSAVLRHNAVKMGISITKNGFVSIDELLSHPIFKNLDFAALANIVDGSEKRRFRMVYGNDGLIYICANQGHSIPGIEPDLKEIKNPSEAPFCIHGTSYAAWNLIKSSGLRPMKRQYIHFAKGLPGSEGVISGMRSTAQVYIYINVPLLLKGGMRLFESMNDVLLCSGTPEERIITPVYFEKVIDAKSRANLLNSA